MKITLEKTQYHRFTLYFDYSPERIEFCRMLKESFGFQRFSYNTLDEKKRWVFSDVIFIKMLSQRFPELIVEPQAMNIWQHEDGASTLDKKRTQTIDTVKEKTDTDLKVKGIRGEMYPYQKIGVEFLMAAGGRAIIADPPGLGKTVQALGYVTHNNIDRVLVICPASVKSAWVNEIEKWTNLSYKVIDGSTNIAKIPTETRVWIANYDILKKHLPMLLKTRFSLMVGDECHYMKNQTALRTKAVRQLARTIPRIVLLSGTPLLSRPVEMFTLLNMLDSSTWSNWYEFTRRYCAGHQGKWGYDASGATNVDELHERIKRYFIRRKKSDVLSQLPPKNRIKREVEFSREMEKKYMAAEKNLVAYLKEYSGKQPSEIARMVQAEKLAQLNILRQLCAVGKIPAAEEVIESVIEADEKVLVFSSFLEPLRVLKGKFGDKAVVITGETPVHERGAIVDRFQKDDKVKVFLGGIKSAGTGITLTAASNVLFLDFSWNPADHQQAEDRVHRPGQEAKSVNIYQLFVRNTIDAKLQKMLDKKQRIFDRVVDGLKVVKEKDDDTLKEVMADLIERQNAQKA